MGSRKTYASTNFLSYKLFFTVQKEDDWAVGRMVLASNVTQVTLDQAVSLTFYWPLPVIGLYGTAEI
jgi:hypothetical protein